MSLTTSQNVTAPKLECISDCGKGCLTTSQNVTAPKQTDRLDVLQNRLTTSQNVTAPKPLKQILFCGRGVLSDQFVASYSIKCWSTTTFLSN